MIPSDDHHWIMSSLSFYPPETNTGTLTSWIPIITTFASPSGCESLYWSYVIGTLAVWDPGYGISVDTHIKCHPRAATSWWDQGRLGVDSATVVSLGPITCPSDYTTVTTMIQNQFSTFVACCPTYVENWELTSPWSSKSYLLILCSVVITRLSKP